jgi:anti-sigma-K factor RskA
MTQDHGRFDELAVGWALHALEPGDEAEFARHLPGCERCRATVAETSEVMAAMAVDLPPAEPSDALRSRLSAAVAGTEQVHRTATPVPSASPVPVPAPRPARRPRRALAAALVAAAVAAVAGLGIWTVVLGSDRQDLQATVAEQGAVLDALLTPGRATIAPLEGGGRQVATVVARDDRVQVIAAGLEVNDAANTTYVVWGLGGSAPEALGTFDVDRSQMTLVTVGSGATGLDDYAQYGISIEPGQEAPSAPTEVVATGQVTS